MKFTGNQISLSSSEEGIKIRMSNDFEEHLIVLSNQEGLQLLSFLISSYGLGEVFFEEEGEDNLIPFPNPTVRH